MQSDAPPQALTPPWKASPCFPLGWNSLKDRIFFQAAVRCSFSSKLEILDIRTLGQAQYGYIAILPFYDSNRK